MEYGQDLAVMAELEKGIKIEQVTRSEYDTDPTHKEKEVINHFISKVHARKSDRIPIKLEGKGPDAYLLQEWVWHKGKGAPRVSQSFKELVRHYGKPSEFMLKQKFKERMDAGGVRFANQGNRNMT